MAAVMDVLRDRIESHSCNQCRLTRFSAAQRRQRERESDISHVEVAASIQRLIRTRQIILYPGKLNLIQCRFYAMNASEALANYLPICFVQFCKMFRRT